MWSFSFIEIIRFNSNVMLPIGPEHERKCLIRFYFFFVSAFYSLFYFDWFRMVFIFFYFLALFLLNRCKRFRMRQYILFLDSILTIPISYMSILRGKKPDPNKFPIERAESERENEKKRANKSNQMTQKLI